MSNIQGNKIGSKRYRGFYSYHLPFRNPFNHIRADLIRIASRKDKHDITRLEDARADNSSLQAVSRYNEPKDAAWR